MDNNPLLYFTIKMQFTITTGADNTLRLKHDDLSYLNAMKIEAISKSLRQCLVTCEVCTYECKLFCLLFHLKDQTLGPIRLHV